MSCHVIWCGGHVIWCDVTACVVSCHVMQCDVMVMSCYLLCPAMGRNVGSVVWFEVVILSSSLYHKVLLCTAKYYSSTTLYRKVLQRTSPILEYYSILQSSSALLLCTTKYYSSFTLYYKVLQRTTPLLPCTTKYWSPYYKVFQRCTTMYYFSTTLYYKYYSTSTTLYYKVLLQYYSALQSIPPVLLCATKN